MPVLCQAACAAPYLAGVGRRYRCAWDACAVRGKNCQPCDSFAAAPGRAHGCGMRALSKRPRARHELDTRNETRTLFSGNESLYLPNVPGNQFVFTTVRRLLRSGGEAPKKCSTFPERSRHVLWDLWSTLIVTPDFSSDLERAPGARSIAEEKSGVTILVIELHWSQGSEHFRSPAAFLGILPRALGALVT